MVHFSSKTMKKFYYPLPAKFQGSGFFVTHILNLYLVWFWPQVFTQGECKIYWTIFNSKALLFVID